MGRAQRALAAALVIGTALAVLSYAAIGAQAGKPTRASWIAPAGSAAAKKNQKLSTAWKRCGKDRPASKRKRCEKRLRSKAKRRGAGRAPKSSPPEEVPTGTPVLPRSPPPPPVYTPEEEMAKSEYLGAPTSGRIEAGAPLYAADCQSCHGPQGEGTATGSDLHAEEGARYASDVVRELISPAPGAMPSFDTTLTFEQKEEVAYYLTVEIMHTEEEILDG